MPLSKTPLSHIPPPYTTFVMASIALLIVSIMLFTLHKNTTQQQPVQNLANQQVLPTPVFLPHLISVSCIKTKTEVNLWDLYSCSLYSLKLPSGWMAMDSEHLEFTNYDPSKAAGRNYSPELDKRKLKFGITLIKTTQDLPTFIRKKTQANQYKILSSNSVTINNYSAIKTSSVGPADDYKNSFTTVYIQNPSKTLIAEVDFIFGFENSFDLLDQILSGFKFT